MRCPAQKTPRHCLLPALPHQLQSKRNDKTTLALPRVSGVFCRVRSVFRKLLARESSRFHIGGVGDQQRSSEAQVRRERPMLRHPGGFLFAVTLNQI